MFLNKIITINNIYKMEYMEQKMDMQIDGANIEEKILLRDNLIKQERWIDATKEQPKLLPNELYSENVLAYCNGKLSVMSYFYNQSQDESERGFFWANCYGYINGDGELDDYYYVEYWQPLPSILCFEEIY